MNGLIEEYPEELEVINVDVQSALGRELVREYGAFTPTFVLFDKNGQELWRAVGVLEPEKVRNQLD